MSEEQKENQDLKRLIFIKDLNGIDRFKRQECAGAKRSRKDRARRALAASGPTLLLRTHPQTLGAGKA